MRSVKFTDIPNAAYTSLIVSIGKGQRMKESKVNETSPWVMMITQGLDVFR